MPDHPTTPPPQTPQPPAWNDLSARPCKHLKSKEMFYNSPTARDDAYASGIFWCQRTFQCIGPDGNVAEHEHCRNHRDCYEV